MPKSYIIYQETTSIVLECFTRKELKTNLYDRERETKRLICLSKDGYISAFFLHSRRESFFPDPFPFRFRLNLNKREPGVGSGCQKIELIRWLESRPGESYVSRIWKGLSFLPGIIENRCRLVIHGRFVCTESFHQDCFYPRGFIGTIFLIGTIQTAGKTSVASLHYRWKQFLRCKGNLKSFSLYELAAGWNSLLFDLLWFGWNIEELRRLLFSLHFQVF